MRGFEMSEVKLGEFIFYGNDLLPKKAIVCRVYDAENIEVVYLDYRNRAINDDMVLKEGQWVFKHQGPSGGYADKYDRLSQFVSQLRRNA
jgi:hypothetical protein